MEIALIVRCSVSGYKHSTKVIGLFILTNLNCNDHHKSGYGFCESPGHG